jgi:benzodiazapine receptor
MIKYNFISFLFFVFVTFISSSLGSFVTLSFKEPWYSNLNKPFFNPPDWIFAPVWTILYLFMAIAIWKVWIKSNNKNIVYLYFIQLFFNTTWSIIFFGLQNIVLSLLNLIVLIILIVLLTIKYKDISRLSVVLMIPYIFWCCFALLLNFYLFLLN